jgi:hypothetical protein
MKLSLADVKSVEKFLQEEIVLCDEYLRILSLEQAAVIKLDSQNVSQHSEARNVVVEKLAKLRDSRALLVERVTGDPFTRVSEMVANGCGPTEKRRLLVLTEKVKGKLVQVDKKTRELNQILSFSLGLVNGEISILWSATQPVARSYTPYGTIQEGVQPGPSRVGSLLGEA